MKTASYARTVHRSPNGRDKVSNGRLLPKTVDMRSAAGRRFRHLVEQYSAELGADLSEVDANLVKQAASLTLAAEQLSADVVQGHPVDSDALIRVNSECRRILSGLKTKAAKNAAAGPSLQEYLAQRAAREAEEPEPTDAT